MIVNINEIGSQGNKVFLVTGANSGLGYETSKFLLAKGATIIMLIVVMNIAVAAFGMQELLITRKSLLGCIFIMLKALMRKRSESLR